MCLYFCGTDYSNMHHELADLAERSLCPLIQAGFGSYSDWKAKSKLAFEKLNAPPPLPAPPELPQPKRKFWTPTLVEANRDWKSLAWLLQAHPPKCAQCGLLLKMGCIEGITRAVFYADPCDDSGKECVNVRDHRAMNADDLRNWSLDSIAAYLWRPWHDGP